MVKYWSLSILLFVSGPALAYDYSEEHISLGALWVRTSDGFYRFTRSEGNFEGCSSIYMHLESSTSDTVRNHYSSLLTAAKLAGQKVKIYWHVGSSGHCRMEFLKME